MLMAVGRMLQAAVPCVLLGGLQYFPALQQGCAAA